MSLQIVWLRVSCVVECRHMMDRMHALLIWFVMEELG